MNQKGIVALFYQNSIDLILFFIHFSSILNGNGKINGILFDALSSLTKKENKI